MPRVFPSILFVVVFALAPIRAWAQGFYFSSDLGGHWAPTIALRGVSNDRESACDEFVNPWYLLAGERCTKPDRGSGDGYRNEYGPATGIVAGAALGYRLSDPSSGGVGGRLRLEMEYFFRQSAYDQTVPVGGAQGVHLSKINQEIFRAEERVGKLTAHNLFGNVYFDLVRAGRFVPYVGFGVGFGFTSMDWGSLWARSANPADIGTGADFPFESEEQRLRFRQNLAGSTSNAQTRVGNVLFGYQALLGVEYALTESVSQGIGFRWARYASFEDTIVWNPLRSHEPNIRRDGSEPVNGWLSTDDIGLLGVSMNLRYRFR